MDITTLEGRYLGAILQDNSRIEAAHVTADDFSDERHLHIWRVIAELIEDGKPANIETVSLMLMERGDSARVGGIDYVTSLTDDALPQSAGEHARAVRDAAVRRRLRASAELLVTRAADGHATSDDLLHSLDNLDSLRQSLSTSGSASIRSIADVPSIFELDPQPIAFLVDELIQTGAITMLAGEPGVGKSYLAHRIAVDVALGGAFLGLDCHRCGVLILDAENPLGLIQTRLEQMTGGPIGGLAVWGGWNSDPPPLIGDSRLLRIAKESKPLIIFDTFLRFHSADENSASEIRPVMAHLRRLADNGASVLLIHHKGKTESKYRGSSDILAGVDCGLALEKNDDGLLTLHRHKSRFGPDRRFTIRPNFETGQFERTDSPIAVRRNAELDNLADLIASKPGISQGDVIKTAGIGRTRGSQLLKENEGKLWRMERGAHGAILYYPITTCTEYRPVPRTPNTAHRSCTAVPTPLGVVQGTGGEVQ